MGKKPKAEDRRPRELASVCVDGVLAEAISNGPDQPLQYAVLESGNVYLRAAVLLRGQEIVPPRDRNGLVTKGVVLLPGKPIPYGTQESLLIELEAFIYRYCDLAPFWVRLSALYPLMTWVYDRFTAVPIFAFSADHSWEERCLQVIGHLATRGSWQAGRRRLLRCSAARSLRRDIRLRRS
jgi:hypothetical protein